MRIFDSGISIWLAAVAGLSFVLWGLVLTHPISAQPIPGFTYTTQLSDTLPHLAQKYLGDVEHVRSIVVATQRTLGLTIPDHLLPGITLFIPSEPLTFPSPTQPSPSTPTPPPAAVSRPEPFGKIAFSFYNRALSRRVWEIDIIQVGGNSRQIYRRNEVSEPAISPDGTQLAFRGWSGNDSGRFLSVGPLSGERHWPGGGFQEDSRPDWSGDGSRLVFASQRESDRLWRLYLIQADGQGERILSRADGLPLFGEDPAWSHRDDRIIYRGCAPDGTQCGLWFITLDGLVSTPIVLDPGAIQPDGSPAADRVVFASSQAGNWDIYRINMDGTDLRRLTTHPAIDGLPTWSPEGEWIAFQSTRPGFDPEHAFEQGPSQGGQTSGGNWGIWIMREDGSDLHQIFAFDGGLMKANRLDLPYGSRDWYDEQISWGR